MMQGLLEAIEMEHGNDYRKEVELKLQQDKGSFIKIDGNSDVISTLYSESLHELAKDPVEFIGEMRDATPEEREYINKCIKEISYPTGMCFWENWQLNQNNEIGINEIDTYISELNSQDNFIAEINSLPMPETYPHEDDRFYIPEEYRKMTKEELKIEQEKLLKEIKRRKQMKEIKL